VPSPIEDLYECDFTAVSVDSYTCTPSASNTPLGESQQLPLQQLPLLPAQTPCGSLPTSPPSSPPLPCGPPESELAALLSNGILKLAVFHFQLRGRLGGRCFVGSCVRSRISAALASCIAFQTSVGIQCQSQLLLPLLARLARRSPGLRCQVPLPFPLRHQLTPR